MNTICNTYNVIPDEPQHGKVDECITTWDRDEIIEAIIEGFLGGDLRMGTDDIRLPRTDIGDDMYDVAEISEFLEQDDIDYINQEMEMWLLDDDYGSGKDWELIFKILDDILPKDLEYALEYDRFWSM